MGLPRTRKLDGKVGKKVAKKHFTEFSAKELKVAKDWFKTDVGGVSHVFFRQSFTRRFETGRAVVEAKLLAN